MRFSGSLYSYKNSIEYQGYIFIPLTTPLTSTSYDGDSFSTSTQYDQLDLSAIFGAPAGIKAVLFDIALRDSGSAAGDTFLRFADTNVDSYSNPAIGCSGLANDKWTRGQLIVPCNASGDVYWYRWASGTSTLDITIVITGYWI
jgi:hypothetical protein